MAILFLNNLFKNIQFNSVLKTSEETIAEVADSSREVRAGPGASPLVGQSREILEEAMLDKLAASSGSSHRLHRHTLAANPLWLRQRQS